MQQTKVNILCTRPLDSLLIEKAKQQDILIDTIEFIRTEPVIEESLKKQVIELGRKALNIVFTSMNAVEAVGDHLDHIHPHWNIFCIGNTTRELVTEKFGASSVTGTANSAGALADLIIQKKDINSVTFFCGDQRREELPAKLSQHSISVDEIIVYKTFNVTKKVASTYDGILFFSPSAVDSFFSSNEAGDQTILFAIGNTTASTIKKYSVNNIIIGETPAKQELVNQMISYFRGS